MSTAGTRFRLIGHLLLGAAMLLGAGCASTPETDKAAAAVQQVWPEPPAEPRLVYVRAFSRPADLGIRKSFFEKLGEFLFCTSDARLIRPMAVVEVPRRTATALAGQKPAYFCLCGAVQHTRIRGI